MTDAYLNRIATAVPPFEVHDFFLRFAASKLRDDPRRQAVFRRMADRAGIRHRYSVIPATEDPEGPVIDRDGLFRRGAFPSTARRMDLFERTAPELAARAVDGLDLGEGRSTVTHLVVTSCTGFSAPGLDLEIVTRAGLDPSVERTQIGFMGCYAAVNALKLARHIVRSEPGSRVLVVNLELCTLHLKETADLEQLLTFCLWGDGCSAALVSAEPTGFRLDSFRALLADNSRELMSWAVRDDGFDMVLSGAVPAAIAEVLETRGGEVLGEVAPERIDLWAVHPGGRSVLDAVERALHLPPDALDDSRAVLQDTGNMSSATVMFVLERMLRRARPGERGCGMAFGPGLTAETFRFEAA
ncbi:type III polyketide synthase [Aureimonas jatrophae]|uniref:Predicted naringenin-chalcone synthase n=1 Tax=Aureimonas jatrophae TaxID=1166073 RepID=A0A1H0K2W6_9HYPH|nr:type III polyketide synthase [Aureimonas jatrophae]MBB3950915.1 putative naringenin-chalcone synthase [Aureimonas jatrophae]SDO50102.1 Predicted naringenin-chalcone synthase [Aureimonas jatrophae]